MESLNPTQLALAVAHGWGGDGNRDVQEAKAARELVLRTAPADVKQQLKALGLDLIPRILTAPRLRQVLAGLVSEGMDGEALTGGFLTDGSVLGLTTALSVGGLWAVTALRKRMQGENLDLSDLNLTSLPAEVAQLPVRSLNLRGNALRALPPALAEMKLRELNLGENRLASLPAELERLTELRALSLHENGLTAVPPAIFALGGLRELSLARNALTLIPEQIGKLAALNKLWLNDNGLRQLPEAVYGMRQLRELSIRHNPWRGGVEERLARSLPGCQIS